MEAAVLQGLIVAWAVAETAVLIRTRARRSATQQGARGSVWVVWMVIGLSLGAAMFAQVTDAPRLPLPVTARIWSGVAVMLVGLALRAWSIATLGRFFSVDVAIQDGHRIVRSGPYARIRHPSYTGMIVAFAGLGIGLGNWLSLALAAGPTTAVLLHRVRVEERALVDEFGEDYERYRAETARLFPGIY